MNTSNSNYSRKTVGIACGLFLFAYGSCYHYLITDYTKPYAKRPNIEIPQSSPHTSNINKVSQWITSGDWSHDNYPLTITIPSQKVVMDIDYVEDHWDDFISDPEDEILYPPDIFQ